MKTFQQFWKSGPLAKLFLVLGAGGVLAGVCVVCAVCGIALSSTPTTRTTTTQADAAPTSAPRPTATATGVAPQVNTPRPIARPAPTTQVTAPASAWTANDLAAFAILNTSALTIEKAIAATETLADAPQLGADAKGQAWYSAVSVQSARIYSAKGVVEKAPVTESQIERGRNLLLTAAEFCVIVTGVVSNAQDEKELAATRGDLTTCKVTIEARRQALVTLQAVPAPAAQPAAPASAWTANDLTAFAILNTSVLTIEKAIAATETLADAPQFGIDVKGQVWAQAVIHQEAQIASAKDVVAKAPVTESQIERGRRDLWNAADFCDKAILAVAFAKNAKELAATRDDLATCKDTIEGSRLSLVYLQANP